MKNSFKKLTKKEYSEYFSQPLWYTEFTLEMEYYFRQELSIEEEQQEEFREGKKRVRKIIIELYKEDKINFAESGQDFDEDRKPIETIVIHHTAGAKDVPWEYINVQHMLSVYVPEYLAEKQPYFKTPLWSGHIWGEKMIFCGYHYLVWQSGKVKQMLSDDQIGWHAGNWDVNTKSIGICVVGDYSDSKPNPEVIAIIKEIISKYPKVRVLGHREVFETTICPGNTFLGKNGWKQELL